LWVGVRRACASSSTALASRCLSAFPHSPASSHPSTLPAPTRPRAPARFLSPALHRPSEPRDMPHSHPVLCLYPSSSPASPSRVRARSHAGPEYDFYRRAGCSRQGSRQVPHACAVRACSISCLLCRLSRVSSCAYACVCVGVCVCTWCTWVCMAEGRQGVCRTASRPYECV